MFGFTLSTETNVIKWRESIGCYLRRTIRLETDRKWKRYLGQPQAAWLVVGRSEARPDRGGSHSFTWGVTWMCQCGRKLERLEGCLGGTGWERWRKTQRNRRQRQRLLVVWWISYLRVGIFASMTPAPPPVPSSSVAEQPAPRLKPSLLMWPVALGSQPPHLLEAGIRPLNSSLSQLLGCWSSWSPSWPVGKLVYVLWRWAAVASPPGDLNSRQESQQQQQEKSVLWVWGAPRFLWGGLPAARPSFFLLSPLQPHRSHRTGLQTWSNGQMSKFWTFSTE